MIIGPAGKPLPGLYRKAIVLFRVAVVDWASVIFRVTVLAAGAIYPLAALGTAMAALKAYLPVGRKFRALGALVSPATASDGVYRLIVSLPNRRVNVVQLPARMQLVAGKPSLPQVARPATVTTGPSETDDFIVTLNTPASWFPTAPVTATVGPMVVPVLLPHRLGASSPAAPGPLLATNITRLGVLSA